jgi:hypothetical protein
VTGRILDQRNADRLPEDGALGNTGWQTPPAFFDGVAQEFGPFDLDPSGAHTAYVSQAIAYYHTEDGEWLWTPDGPSKISNDDGLARLWTGRVFCNPPYRRVEAWVKQGRESAAAGALVVMLLAPSTDARWFHRYVWDARLHRAQGDTEVRFLEGRIRFLHPAPAQRETDFKGFRPISGNMLVIFHPPMTDAAYLRREPGHKGGGV